MTLEIANTIRQQLGGNRFAAMTGAKDFVGGSNFLQFSIGKGATNKANKVRVTLETNDTYMIEFFKCRAFDVRSCGPVVRGVYADRLQAVFTEHTGFDTHL